MLTLAEVMARGMYYDQVQRLAREHDLPISRTKDELIEELVNSVKVSPAEVVAYLNVDLLRVFLQEMGLPSGAGREVLADRLAQALDGGLDVPRKARRARSKLATQDSGHPVARQTSATPPILRPLAQPSPPSTPSRPINVQDYVTSAPPPIKQVNQPKPERPSAAWGFAGILTSVIVGATLFVGVSLYGLETGTILAIVGGTLLAVALLITSRWWVPWIDRLAG